MVLHRPVEFPASIKSWRLGSSKRGQASLGPLTSTVIFASFDLRRQCLLISQEDVGGGVGMRVWTRGRSASVVTLLLVQVSFASPQQHKRIKTGSEADINSIGNRKVGHGPDFYSVDREITLGTQLAEEADRSTKFIDDPLVNEYVTRIGQNLVRDSDARFPFTFKVIDSEEVNAFALPGGFLYVNRGTILLADGEAELAGVLAHEIAHVSARHGTRNCTRREIARAANMSLILLGPGGWAGYAIFTGLKVGVPLTFLKFSRSAESEADYLGLQYMYKVGYDPNALIAFFERMDSEPSPGKFATMFSSFPPTRNRIKAIQREIATILPARDQYIVTTSEFDLIKSRLLRREQGKRTVWDGSRPELRTRTEPDANDPSKPDR
jgi:predicted Zn-dependent protease